MGWFNPIKGAYPSLQQISKTLPVHADSAALGTIVRGSLVYANEDGAGWMLAEVADDSSIGKYMYFALQAQDDLTAGMAGSKGQGPARYWDDTSPDTVGTNMGAGTPTITALACGQPFEFETDQYDAAAGALGVGGLLTAGVDGVLTAHDTGENCVGQVTKVATSRWVNNAVAVTGFRTGNNVSVLTARTLWLPRLVTA